MLNRSQRDAIREALRDLVNEKQSLTAHSSSFELITLILKLACHVTSRTGLEFHASGRVRGAWRLGTAVSHTPAHDRRKSQGQAGGRATDRSQDTTIYTDIALASPSLAFTAPR